MTNERWAYQVIEIKPSFFSSAISSSILQAELNRQGQHGWELVSATPLGPWRPHQLVFKRRV